MPLGSTINSLMMIVGNINTDKPTKQVIKNRKKDKPATFPRGEEVNFLPRSKPSKHGYSEEYINSFFRELESDLSIRANRCLIVKDNYVIGEKYEYPYVKDAWDHIFSATKTVTTLALGLLYDEGKIDLDAPVYKILKIKPGNAANKKITLRHLLTMTTGVLFNEVESAATTKWVKGFFSSGAKFKVGKKFDYNSLNTYIISVAIEKIAGISFEEFIKERIFKPLDMNSCHLDKSPEGYFKGGWGLYILPEDMAKLGILVKDKGVYNNKRIISEKWIEMMSSKQIEAIKYGRRFDYGFQMWVCDEHHFCMFNGLYNQDIIIFKETGVVLVVASSNGEAFHGSNYFDIAIKYFASKEKTTELCKTKGSRDIANLSHLNYYYDKIANQEYLPLGKIANSCGVLPLLIQNEVGTYAQGIKSVYFKKENDQYALVINEGKENYELPFNFENGVRNIYNFYGNLFDCVCDGRFMLTAKGLPLFVFRMFFLEYSSSRYITVKFDKRFDLLSLELSEYPGFDFIASLMDEQDEVVKNLLNSAMKAINPAILKGKIKDIFAPNFMIKKKEEK